MTNDLPAPREADVAAKEPTRATAKKEPRWRLPVLLAMLAVVSIVAAVVGYQRHLERSPDRCFARAVRAIEADEWSEVEREYASLKDATGFEPQAHFLLGAMLLRAGRPIDALQEFSACRNEPELKVLVQTLAGQALYQAGDIRGAEQVLREVVGSDPTVIDAHRWLGALYYDLGAADNAVTELEIVAERAPLDPRPHRLMGLMNKDYERFDIAIGHYQESLRRLDAGATDGKLGLDSKPKPLIFPENYREDLLLELAECQVKQREYEAALKTLEPARASADRDTLRAECVYSQGKTSEARDLAALLITDWPDHVPALTLHGTLMLDTGDTDAALTSLRRAVELSPKDYAANYKLAQALRQSKDTSQADRQAKIADGLQALRQDFADLHVRAAREPRNAQVRFLLGKAALELERPELAMSWFKAALALDPSHPGARQYLHNLPANAP